MKHLAAMGNRPFFKVKSSMDRYIHTLIYIYIYSIYIYIYIQCIYIYYIHSVYIYIYTAEYIYIYRAGLFQQGFLQIFQSNYLLHTPFLPGSLLLLRQAEFQIFETSEFCIETAIDWMDIWSVNWERTDEWSVSSGVSKCPILGILDITL